MVYIAKVTVRIKKSKRKTTQAKIYKKIVKIHKWLYIYNDVLNFYVVAMLNFDVGAINFNNEKKTQKQQQQFGQPSWKPHN